MIVAAIRCPFALADERDLMSQQWDHDELANDLAKHLRSENRMVWVDMQLGPQGSPRPDVYALFRSYTQPNPIAYEVKISVSDFRADVTTAKWSRYLNYAYAVVFAVPAGLIGKADVPDSCGLIVRNDSGWRMAKKPTLQPRNIDQQALLKLVIDGVSREGPRNRAIIRNPYDSIAKKVGSEAARYIQDATSTMERIKQAEDAAQRIISSAKNEAERIRKHRDSETPARWAELLTVLELGESSSNWEVIQAIQKLKRLKTTEGGTVQIINELRRIIETHGNVT